MRAFEHARPRVDRDAISLDNSLSFLPVSAADDAVVMVSDHVFRQLTHVPNIFPIILDQAFLQQTVAHEFLISEHSEYPGRIPFFSFGEGRNLFSIQSVRHLLTAQARVA